MSDLLPQTSSIPVWADEELSLCIPELAAAGEQQDVEFKERFPDNVRDLAKEIAAFATSNDGTIILGVSDGGDIQGYVDAMLGTFDPCADLVAPAGVIDAADTAALVNLLAGP